MRLLIRAAIALYIIISLASLILLGGAVTMFIGCNPSHGWLFCTLT